ncbi:PP2C family protein-serine/threonine phosphatase [Streptomyces sp. NPDC020298]|uniref:PP2C family protein-serine/threonine phosphatase n=1 Tax=unclassified Streptomyces TaxID=2593676 RepID=UPI0033CBF290
MIRIKARAPTRQGYVRRPLRRALALAVPTGWGALAVGTGLIVHVHRTLLHELRQARRVAGAAQSVLLRPPPPRVGGLSVAAAQLSADRGAAMGGDLYEAVATEHGVRVVMGDVRGHGLSAIGTVAAVLGSFREAAHDEPALDQVLRRLDRTLARHLRERARTEHPWSGLEPDTPVAEEFVTVLLLEFTHDGEIHALNCGHPWPYLLSGARIEPLTRADPLPPLGLFPLPPDLPALHRGRLLPGETLVLYTDGAEDARDARGRFFSLPTVLAEAAGGHSVTPQTILRKVFTALLRHTNGTPTDDIALLVLRDDRPSRAWPTGAGAGGQATAFRGGAGGPAGLLRGS